jgi:4-amino-4-deoxy-L-arabinose transferase-like glycosyltransferase
MTVLDAPPHGPLEPTVTVDAAASRPRSWFGRVWRGRPEDAAWIRPALLILLGGTAALYIWGLSASGYANSFYSAAVQAGTKSWKAFLFGSSDASNFITVDKTPASLWPAVAAARVFGVNSWSLLVPQAVEGVLAVGFLYLTIRRWFGAPAGLLAGLVFATTPAATLIFRFNNPDALLVLCLVVGAYGVTRAIEDGRTRWLLLAGAGVGLGFLAKELQAFLVLPGFAAGYFLAGPGTWWRRFLGLVEMGVAMLVSAGWFVAILVLTPASSRPYIGGSQNNSFWNVLFGYNGFGRLTGNESGSVGGGAPGTSGRWGPTGLTRMFNPSFGDGASWLLPTALFLLVVGLVISARAARTDRTRAALIIWGGWLLVTGLSFSLGKGIIHEYYTVALAPAIGAVVAIGAAALWKHRAAIWSRVLMAVALAITVWWTVTLLDRSPDWHDGLDTILIIGAAVVAIGLIAGATRRLALALFSVAAVVVATAAPIAASVTTARTAHSGPLPTAGPAVRDAGFGGGSGGRSRCWTAPRIGTTVSTRS